MWRTTFYLFFFTKLLIPVLFFRLSRNKFKTLYHWSKNWKMPGVYLVFSSAKAGPFLKTYAILSKVLFQTSHALGLTSFFWIFFLKKTDLYDRKPSLLCRRGNLLLPWNWCGQCSSLASWWQAYWDLLVPETKS